jgi:hypothetical protein
VLKALLDELVKFTAQLLTSAHIASHVLDTETLINSVIEESECLKKPACAKSVRAGGETKGRTYR